MHHCEAEWAKPDKMDSECGKPACTRIHGRWYCPEHADQVENLQPAAGEPCDCEMDLVDCPYCGYAQRWCICEVGPESGYDEADFGM